MNAHRYPRNWIGKGFGATPVLSVMASPSAISSMPAIFRSFTHIRPTRPHLGSGLTRSTNLSPSGG